VEQNPLPCAYSGHPTARDDEQDDPANQGNRAEHRRQRKALAFIRRDLERAGVDHGFCVRPEDPAPDQRDDSDHDECNSCDTTQVHHIPLTPVASTAPLALLE